jgi:hypothetical protein
MDERLFELSELQTRISQLEHLLKFRVPQATVDAIQDHVTKLRKRLLELECASIPRTNT